MLKFDFISNDSLINIPDTLIIHRHGPNNEIDLNIAFYDTLQEFIDTTAYDTGQYIYSTSVKNNNGRSLFFDDSTSSTVNHIIPEITDFKIDKIFCDSILLSEMRFHITTCRTPHCDCSALTFVLQALLSPPPPEGPKAFLAEQCRHAIYPHFG